MEIQRYTAADLPTLFDKITKNSIGMDSYFDSFWNTTQTNYPPYNLIQLNNEESRLEIALCLLYTSPSPRDSDSSRMPSSA